MSDWVWSVIEPRINGLFDIIVVIEPLATKNGFLKVEKILFTLREFWIVQHVEQILFNCFYILLHNAGGVLRNAERARPFDV